MANDIDMFDFYNYLTGYPAFPSNFNSKDKMLCHDLFVWGECEEKPRDEVLTFYENSMKDK